MGTEEGTFWDEHWVLYGNQFDNKFYMLKNKTKQNKTNDVYRWSAGQQYFQIQQKQNIYTHSHHKQNRLRECKNDCNLTQVIEYIVSEPKPNCKLELHSKNYSAAKLNFDQSHKYSYLGFYFIVRALL